MNNIKKAGFDTDRWESNLRLKFPSSVLNCTFVWPVLLKDMWDPCLDSASMWREGKTDCKELIRYLHISNSSLRSRKMPQLIIFESRYWESRYQMLKCAFTAVWPATLTSPPTWNNWHLEKSVWQWWNTLVLAHQKVIVLPFKTCSQSLELFPLCVCLLWALSMVPSQSKPLHWFHWEQRQKLPMNKLCVWDDVFQVVELALMSHRTNAEYNSVLSCC